MGSAVRVTSAAEGLPRRRFTVAEVEAMVAAGVMEEDERVELIGGELVPMSPKGNQHEVLKTALLRRWYRACAGRIRSHPRDHFSPQRRHVSRARRRHLSAHERNPRTDGRERPSCRRDRRLVASLRYRPQGGALRQFRHPRALGHRRGSTDDASFPRANAPTAIATRRTSAPPIGSSRSSRRRAFTVRLDELELELRREPPSPPHACFLSFTTLCSVWSAVSKKRRTPRAAWRMRCSFSTSARRT